MTGEDEPVGREQRAGTAILVILVASLALKLVLLVYVGNIAPVFDEVSYRVAGRSIAAGEGIRYDNPKWDALYQPPLYPYLMGLFYLRDGGHNGVKLFQVFLSTLTAWIVFLVARGWFGRRTAVWSAAIFAFYPTLVAFTHYNWSETVFLFWFVAAIYFLFEPGPRIASATSLLFAGVLFGMAAQTRAVAIYLVPLLVPLVHLSTRDVRATLRRGGALLGGLAIALAPLTYSIWKEHGGFLLVSTQPAKIWHESYNTHEPLNVDLGFEHTWGQTAPQRPPSETANPVERQREEMRSALAFMVENPLLCARRAYLRATYLFNPSSFLVRHLREGHYDKIRGVDHRGPVPEAAVEAVVALTVASYLAVATLGLIGLFAMPRGLVHAFAVGTLLYFTVLSALTYATTRYRIPFLPVLIPCAAYALTHLGACLRALRAPRRAVPFALVYALLVHWWSLYLHLNWS